MMYLQTILTFIQFGVLSAFAPQSRINVLKLLSSSSFEKTAHTPLSAKRGGAMSRRKKSKGGGFAKDTDEQNKEETEPEDKESSSVQPIKVSKPGSIYSRPALYDLAFGYRNYDEEVKFLLDVHEEYSTGENKNSDGCNILELAAGPARHTITALRNNGLGSVSVNSCTAVDLSEDMVQYSNEIADEELGDAGYGGMRDRFKYILEDMRTIDKSGQLQPSSFDSAWILLGSMQHLTLMTM